MPTRRPQLLIRIPRVVPRRRDILTNHIQIRALLVHHVRHIAEQLVELADALLDIANFGLALDNEGFLEVDFTLVGEDRLLLLELLLRLTALLGRRCGAVLVERGALGGGGGALFLQRLALQALELGEGGFEFGVEFVLGVFLGGLMISPVSVSSMKRVVSVAYPQVRPILHLLQPIADIFKAVARLLQQVLYSLSYAIGLSLRAEQRDLLAEPRAVGGEGEELIGEVGSEAVKFRVVSVFGVVLSSPCCGLCWEGLVVTKGRDGHGEVYIRDCLSPGRTWLWRGYLSRAVESVSRSQCLSKRVAWMRRQC